MSPVPRLHTRLPRRGLLPLVGAGGPMMPQKRARWCGRKVLRGQAIAYGSACWPAASAACGRWPRAVSRFGLSSSLIRDTRSRTRSSKERLVLQNG